MVERDVWCDSGHIKTPEQTETQSTTKIYLNHSFGTKNPQCAQAQSQNHQHNSKWTNPWQCICIMYNTVYRYDFLTVHLVTFVLWWWLISANDRSEEGKAFVKLDKKDATACLLHLLPTTQTPQQRRHSFMVYVQQTVHSHHFIFCVCTNH